MFKILHFARDHHHQQQQQHQHQHQHHRLHRIQVNLLGLQPPVITTCTSSEGQSLTRSCGGQAVVTARGVVGAARDVGVVAVVDGAALGQRGAGVAVPVAAAGGGGGFGLTDGTGTTNVCRPRRMEQV